MKLVIDIPEEMVKALEQGSFGAKYNMYDLVGCVMNGKPIEQEPKTGHWSHDGSHWKYRWICSECGYKLIGEQTRFCPNCGAKMEGRYGRNDDRIIGVCNRCNRRSGC